MLEQYHGRTSIMMTASAMVRRVVPPMNAPAPNSAKTPGSIHAHGLGGRNTLAELQQGCNTVWEPAQVTREPDVTVSIERTAGLHAGIALHHQAGVD